MVIPTTYAAALLLSILSLVCWGSWANTIKLSGKWRFELFYFDYAFGVLLLALAAGLTFGSMDGGALVQGAPMFSFADNLAIASKRQLAYAGLGGVVFNLANLLLVAAITVAGMSVAFPIGIGLALIIGVVLNYMVRPAGSVMLLSSGVLLIVCAIIITALAYGAKAAAEAKRTPAPEPDRRPGKGKGPGMGAATKGVILSLAAGVLMGLFYPLVELSKTGDFGLGPYAAAFMFAVGVFVSTPIFNLFFMNLPVEGPPVSFKDYFQGTFWQHAMGWAGGIIWCIGAVANFVAASAPPQVNIGPAISYAIGQGATLASVLWGLLVWKEFAGADSRVQLRVALMLIFYVAGLAVLSVAPLYR